MSARLPHFVRLDDIADLRRDADVRAKKRKAARRRVQASKRRNR